jgi:hypothetical protein
VIAKYALAFLCCGWLLVGCKFDDHRKLCRDDSDCLDGSGRCYDGFCIKRTPTSMNEIPSGRSGGGAGGKDTGGTGAIDAGNMSVPDTGVAECEGNDKRPCVAPWQDAPALGGCGDGMQHCVDGLWGSCTPNRMMIGPESCNKFDDDCDGEVDEDSDVQCYPAGSTGCEPSGQGQFNCLAPCKAGMQQCAGGKLGQCSGYTMAAATDDCSTEQIDEDCNGTPNDNCQCTGNQTRECYTGPKGTQGVGICRAGMQQCSNGRWGACQGAVTMRVEVCNDEDDDCDGNVDNLAGVGTRCTVPAQQGVCSEGTLQCPNQAQALQCVATTPQPGTESCNGRDDDCNGTIDDVPAAQLQTDAMHCGSCTRVCNANDKCCGGQCVNSNDDENNCGICGKKCAMGEQCMNGTCMMMTTEDSGVMCDAMRRCATDELCCGGKCVPNDTRNCGTCGTICGGTAPGCCMNQCQDLSQNSNCGSCGNVCRTPDGGTPCTCATTGTVGVFECRNGSLACQ